LSDLVRILKIDQAEDIVDKLKWAAVRTAFYAYIGISLATVVGGYILAPVGSYLFLGDWRFWRHGRLLLKLLPHGYKLLFLILRGENNGFLLSVPLASPPTSAPDRSTVRLSADWDEGEGCSGCVKCCAKIDCPILDSEHNRCHGYDSLYWRYFNCGRFPSAQSEIDYYACRKWEMKPPRKS
jgi:hypothetical protein